MQQSHTSSATCLSEGREPRERGTAARLGPYSIRGVARVAALPASSTDLLASNVLHALLVEHASIESGIRAKTEKSSEELFKLIGSTEDSTARSWLLQLRRALHNSLLPSGRNSKDAVDLKSAPATVALVELLQRRTSLLQRIHTVYGDVIAHGYGALLDLTSNAVIADGVAFSSPALSVSARGLLRGERARTRMLRSRDQQVLRGVLRYALRASRKATPYATFCHVVPISWRSGCSSGEDAVQRSTTAVIGRARGVRLNKVIFGVMWDNLKKDAAARMRLHVELNPSTTFDADGVRFLARVGSREVFQQVDRTPVVEYALASLRNVSRPMRHVMSDICGEGASDSDLLEAREFVEALIEIGLVRFASPVPNRSADWAMPLGQLARSISSPTAQVIADYCDFSEDTLELIANGDSAERSCAMGALRERTANALAAMGASPLAARIAVVYEDCGAEHGIELDTIELTPVLNSLHHLLTTLVNVGHPRPDMEQLTNFFERRYARDAHVPLLKFFEDHERDQAERRAKAAESSSEDEDEPRRWKERNEALRQRWLDGVTEAWRGATPHAVELHVSSSLLRTSEIALMPDPHPWSISTFCQVVPGTNGAPSRMLIDSLKVYPGFGKYFSRFLHILPVGQTDELREVNQSLTDALLVEVDGDGNFNGNLHPPLVGGSVAYPAGDGDVLAEKVQCTDIHVVCGEDTSAGLHLVDVRTGRRLVPVDLGFLNPMMRPPLFRLIQKFSPIGPSQLPLPSTMDGKSVGESRIVHRPRIVVDKQVVVARRSWRMPTSLIPTREAGEAGVDHFVRFWSWWQTESLPERFYFRLLVRRGKPAPASPSNGADTTPGNRALDLVPADPEGQTHADDAQKQPESNLDGIGTKSTTPVAAQSDRPPRSSFRSRDWFKPQFCIVSSPLHVDLLWRAVRDVPTGDLIIEEEYPSAHSSPMIADEHHMCELLLQFDHPTGIEPAHNDGHGQ